MLIQGINRQQKKFLRGTIAPSCSAGDPSINDEERFMCKKKQEKNRKEKNDS